MLLGRGTGLPLDPTQERSRSLALALFPKDSNEVIPTWVSNSGVDILRTLPIRKRVEVLSDLVRKDHTMGCADWYPAHEHTGIKLTIRSIPLIRLDQPTVAGSQPKKPATSALTPRLEERAQELLERCCGHSSQSTP